MSTRTGVLALLALVCAVFVAVTAMPPQPIVLQPPIKPLKDYNISTEELMHIPGPDMILTDEQQSSRSGIIGERYRWRGGLYMQIDRAFSRDEFLSINAALYDIHAKLKLCINIFMWPQGSNPAGDYVFIRRGQERTGCWSYVGKQGGRQILNLEVNAGCVHYGIVVHETIHALGFFHEHSRSDRDDYVLIHRENIAEGMEYNFDRYNNTFAFDVPYDYTSIMHYNKNAFTKNGQDTLTSKNGSLVGSRGHMTDLDLEKLHRMYC